MDNSEQSRFFAETLESDFLKCPVCSDELQAPKILPCLHSFCFKCLKSSLDQSGIGNGQKFLCPLCKFECTVPPRGVAAMKTNIFVVTLQEYLDRRSLEDDQTCEGCDSNSRVKRKCLECNDWLCAQCCQMHKKVRMTSDHTLASASELQSGKYDQQIKDTVDPLYCSIHGEPLKLYCTHPSCCAPICTVCKTTSGHDGHVAKELDSQARVEAEAMSRLLGNAKKTQDSANVRIERLKDEEKTTKEVIP